MKNLNALTLDQLLQRVQIIDDLMPSLTQRGLDKAQDELSAIEAELDSRQPEGVFQTLYEIPVNWREHHSIYCGTRTRACHTTTCPKYIYEDSGGQWIGKIDIVGFEPIYGTDLELLPDDYGLQPQF